ncbi:MULTISPECIES: hypothetical protein [unclassified Mesorhizobium]|uniref:hypothetical protein n=1 Tax=unclassified Mesorhizobium TaxID=325217 RepID=UPI000FDB4BFC|nr:MULTISPECIES: hypothetical protein [unclassified Mesorhizobium]TGT72034.1 hypothetical protein EN809_017975 [Mesorhizobium sp. M2E.F.Ca.ET.166.01.1.1]TGV99253.1 hypothetical protein EN797_023280 [Mesorhizobium sp. M2E.F.Ca.ET.154.01.1.1]
MTHAVSHTSITHAAEPAQQRVNEPAWERQKSDFVICVRNSFGYEPQIDTDKAIGAVFRLLDRPISHGEIVEVRNSMKKSLRQLWPEE